MGVTLIVFAVSASQPTTEIAGATHTASPSDQATPASAPPSPDVVPPALLTETGVPVTVRIRASDGRYVVTTPCGRRATIAGGTPMDGATVVIDPGHGGPIDTGAVQNGIIERDLNMSVATALANVLRGRGISVVLTRTGDYGAILSTRAALADALGARLMVSIHHNSAPNPPPVSTEPGTEVFVQRSAASERLGGLLYEHVTDALSFTYDVGWYRSADAGVLRVTQPDGAETYGMIRNPATTTALIEMGWLLNPVEAADVFESASYRSVAARALADAIEEYLAATPSDVPVGRRTFTANRAMGTDRCTDPALE
jgi:N-acetylmuramoyl-L-alanine amidase